MVTVGAIAKARAVDKQQKRDKVCITFFFKDPGEISFNVSWTSEARVVAQDSQRVTISDDSPQRAVAGVEVFLHGSVRRATAAFWCKTRIALVEIISVRQQQ